MDLFTPLVEEKKLHPNFFKIVQDSNDFAQKVILNWAEGFVDRDNKFVFEFQTTFNSSFWELYIFACLKQLNLSIDFTYSSPDFVVNRLNEIFIIEAATANNAADSPEEWKRDIESLENMDINTVVDFATIRLANALVSKYKKYKSSYAGLSHVKGKPFIRLLAKVS